VRLKQQIEAKKLTEGQQPTPEGLDVSSNLCDPTKRFFREISQIDRVFIEMALK
jgi:hypothetical protein